MATLKTGDGTRGCDMGPLITKEHRDKVASYIDKGRDQGERAVVVVGQLDDARLLREVDVRRRVHLPEPARHRGTLRH